MIFFYVVAVLAIAVIIGCKKMSKAKKYVVRWNSVLAILTALVVVLNMTAFESISTLPGLVTGVLDGIFLIVFILTEIFIVHRGYLKRSCQIRIETEKNVTDKKEE